MFSESMLNNMTGFELAHYVKLGNIDSLSSDLVMKIVNDYDDRIERLKEEVRDLEGNEKSIRFAEYNRGYNDAIDNITGAIENLRY